MRCSQIKGNPSTGSQITTTKSFMLINPRPILVAYIITEVQPYTLPITVNFSLISSTAETKSFILF